MNYSRYFSSATTHPFDEINWVKRRSVISNPDGSIVFEMNDATIPEGWSQLATDIVVSKYFRKSGLGKNKKEGETSVRQVIRRIARTIRRGGEKLDGYFSSAEDAEVFEEELTWLLVNQYGAFNSPVWFNCGLYEEYGIEGSGGNWAWRPASETIEVTKTAYEYPQCSACFIQKAPDDLMGIFDLLKFEARLFKYGSGTGSNFSAIRGRQEKLSGGGNSSGLMSFLEVFDRAAGATKSGGTTRRAAKMVCLDMDHPEIEDFIQWKSREEGKAKALIAAGYDSDFNGESYRTVSGQNSNNSLRITDQFMHAVEEGTPWETIARTTGEVVDTLDARKLWRTVAQSAWECADPGVQYDTTINKWHTCPNSGRINASNPCSEYMFLDNTACNLSSLNLTQFLNEEGDFDVPGYRHAVDIFFTAQEILVDLSSYPTEEIAQNSHNFRPLGLGFANLGSLLMRWGIAYDSDRGRALAGTLTAIMCGRAYAQSARLAKDKSPFAEFEKNRDPMLKVMRMHQEAARSIEQKHCPEELWNAAQQDWDAAVSLGLKHGYRNAQATVLAPTGTIGLLMDCDTTGVEPDFSLVKFKKLAGGGYFKIVNQSVPAALEKLGYSKAQSKEIVHFVSGLNSLNNGSLISRSGLSLKGLTDDDLENIERSLCGVFDLNLAFAPWVLGAEAYKRLGVDKEAFSRPGFSLLKHLGFTDKVIEEASDLIIGHMTVEGSPHLKKEDYCVFDCANRCGKNGVRFLSPSAHINMMGATGPFLSGAISKTINVPHEAGVEEIRELYEQGWRLGLKAIALYRDGCKASQPLSSRQTKNDASRLFSQKEVDQAVKVAVKKALENAPPLNHGERHRLPQKRHGFTQEAVVGGHKIFLRTGEYANGTLGEIFIDMHKEGAAFRSLMNCFAMSISLGLQHGVPLDTYVEQFTFTRFEPHGPVGGHPNIKFATSIVDYLFRVLGVEYLQRYDFAQVKTVEQSSLAIERSSEVSEVAPRKKASLDSQLDELMGDAPVCDTCGHITVRNGSCYKCLNCGNSMGCS